MPSSPATPQGLPCCDRGPTLRSRSGRGALAARADSEQLIDLAVIQVGARGGSSHHEVGDELDLVAQDRVSQLAGVHPCWHAAERKAQRGPRWTASPVSGPNDPRDYPKCSSPVVTSGHAGVTCARTFRRQTGASLLDRSDTLSRRSDTPDRHRSPGRCRQAIVRDHESTSDQVVHKRESEPLAHVVWPICGRDCVRRLGRRWRRGRTHACP